MMPASASLSDLLHALPPDEIKAAIDSLSNADALAILFDWPTWARPNQLAPPGNWRTWLVLAGRGWGKTKTGAEWVRSHVESGNARRIALVAATAADARDVMVEGDSGILECSSPWCKPVYEPSKRRVIWPNGAQATCYSAEEPRRLRGPQHDLAWCDELAAWQYPETWDMLQFGLRRGRDPRAIVTTTPTPTPIIRTLIADPDTVVTKGTTFENRANLPPKFLAYLMRKYDGTRLGRQELNAELLEDVPGALWQRSQIDAARVKYAPEKLRRVVVSVDPAVTSGEDSDETGIVVAATGVDGHAYILADLSCRLSPDQWAKRAVAAYHDFKADRIVAEVNNGGDLVERILRTVDHHVSYRAVRASRGKVTRAEPIAALYEQGRVHHVGNLAQLEDQLCLFTPDGEFQTSPDRADALVWALTDLMLGGSNEPVRMVSWA